MDLLTKSVYPPLHRLNLLETLLLGEIGHLLKLSPLSCRQLKVPFSSEVFRNFLLAQMRHPLLDFVEILVFKDFEGCRHILSRHFALLNLCFDFHYSVFLGLRQNRMRDHSGVVLV